MKKPELLLPAGTEKCLRAAVNNGADAVYFGLNKFNARQSADNFNEKNIFSAIDYCHKRDVKVYITLNTLIKNNEIEEYLKLINLAYCAKADAIIIQDPCFIPIIKKNFPKIEIHMSTQAGITNDYAIPDKVKRIILPRELSINEIKELSNNDKNVDLEVFCHGALCFCYSGMCLFSSMIGGRSGNRGRCAQPCRRVYNNKYSISTMDLCILSKIPELIKSGVVSFKVEGRLRSPEYVATVARVYRKYIDDYIKNKKISIQQKDLDDLMIVFNREFTTGFGFNDSITDTKQPMNRGLYIGNLENGKIKLKKGLKVGDGIALWIEKEVYGQRVDKISIEGSKINKAVEGNIIEIPLKNKNKTINKSIPVYKTSSIDIKVSLGDEIKKIQGSIIKKRFQYDLKKEINKDIPKLFVKVYNKKSAIEADKAKADIVYYDILKSDCEQIKNSLNNSKFFVFTPKVLSKKKVDEIIHIIKRIEPEGVLVSDKGLLNRLNNLKSRDEISSEIILHTDYTINCFNDIDLEYIKATPLISPELSFEEIKNLKNKNFIQFIHGDIVLMTSKEKINSPELVDESDRHFNVRKYPDYIEILNSKQLGLFNKIKEFIDIGIKYFYIDLSRDVGKFTRIYRDIINNKKFDDLKIRKGYTTGHLNKGVE